ncbi:MAG: hypothetical protein ACRCVJ_18600 [Clostridium sp.]|uniref:hypothetical protein n=1 Tax=Clostridium sp. TaxID=1506 RepID=UPI003F34FC7A
MVDKIVSFIGWLLMIIGVVGYIVITRTNPELETIKLGYVIAVVTGNSLIDGVKINKLERKISKYLSVK